MRHAWFAMEIEESARVGWPWLQYLVTGTRRLTVWKAIALCCVTRPVEGRGTLVAEVNQIALANLGEVQR